MDKLSQRVYLHEIRAQSQFALIAFSCVERLLLELESSPLGGPPLIELYSDVFRQSHSFLTHCAIVSRMFWPIPPKKRAGETEEQRAAKIADVKGRGECLRDLLAVRTGNALENQDLRNHLEHYDDRLDDWRARGPKRNLGSMVIGPRSAIAGFEDADVMRRLDPSNLVFSFCGQDFHLRPLQLAVAAVGLRATTVGDSLHVPSAGA